MLPPASIAPPLASPAACFHCGADVADARWRCDVGGTLRAFCCAGCMAVARTIDAAGLAAFYERRSTPAGALPDEEEWQHYDATAGACTRVADDGSHEASLLVEGIHCAACVWLIERWLARAPGVSEVSVNLATRRARVRFDATRAKLSDLLRAIAVVGYRAYPYDPDRREALARRESRALLTRSAVAVLAMMQVMMLAVPGYASDDGIERDHRALLDWASFALTLPVMFYSAVPFYAGAWRDLAHRRLGMDVPVVLGMTVAFAASVWGGIAGGIVYYDSVTMFVALLLVARYVELVGRHKAAAALEGSARERPQTALRLPHYPDTTHAEPVQAAGLVPGDCVRVLPGAVIPADGIVLDGRSSVEEAVLTGESAPQRKRAGERVLAGSINRESALVVRVTAAGEATALASIARMAEQAANHRPAAARLADRVAAVFVAVLLLVAAATALAWWHVDPSRMLAVTVAVLVVSCPCALSLATPAALAATAGALARRNVVVVKGGALETLAGVTHAVLDKTGTLTSGRLALRALVPLGALDRAACLALAAALEQSSEHPIARTLRALARPSGASHDVLVVPGYGVEGIVGGRCYRLGRPDWVGALHRQPLPAAAHEADADATCVALGDASGWIAWLTLGDALKAGAQELVRDLERMRIAATIASGDRMRTVRTVARRAGVAAFVGDATPGAKLDYVASLQANGAIVAMVGDGVNDAPGLARADVSMSFAAAATLPQWTADIVLLRDDPRLVAEAIATARRGFRAIRQNFAWAIAYNAVAIPLAASGQLTPLAAALGMTASSLLVVGNALRLLRMPSAVTSGTRLLAGVREQPAGAD
jgi:Cu2+-exporting ATPase